MLKIYCDENIELAIVQGLKRRGIHAWSANEADNLGLSDEQQLEYAIRQQASLFTYDFDFIKISEQLLKQGRRHNGIFLVHPLNATIGDCIRKLKGYAEIMEPEDVMNQIIFL